MANTTTYTLILDQSRAKEFIMPAGYWPDVEIHCWGAGGGGGWGGSTGGGGGYAKVVTNVAAGDRIRLQIGQPGKNAASQEAGGIGGTDGTDARFKGGSGGGRLSQNLQTVPNYYSYYGFGQYYGSVTIATGGAYPSGGGGGASWVSVNDSVVCVGAGGGGGGGQGGTNYVSNCYQYGYYGIGGFNYANGGYVGISGVNNTLCTIGGIGYVGYGNGNTLLNFVPYTVPSVTPTKYNGNPGGVYPGQASTVYAVSNGAWSAFLNTHGVWGAGQDYTVSINFPTSGTYTFRYSVDNYGSISLDGSPVITRVGENNYQTFYSQTVSVTAGVHTVRLQGFNISGPAGVGAQILKPDSSELWSSRALLVTSGLTSNSQGETTSLGGGGGGGYLGGRGGIASSSSVTGGNGGLNYGSYTEAGSGVFPGGRTGYYPGNKIGEAGYPGYIVLILRKKLNAFIKNPDSSGEWAGIESSYVKVPTQSMYVTQVPPPESISFSTAGTASWTVPEGVTSATFKVAGGAGGAGGGDVGGDKNNTGGGGGGGSNFKSITRAVNPGEVYTFNIGRGGAGAGGGGQGGTGGTSTISLDGNVLLSAAGGTGGGRGGNNGNGAPGIGSNGANNGSGLNGGKSTNGGPTGGTGVARYASTGGTGGGGSVQVLYQRIPEQVLVVTGGWKQIQQAFIKINGEWKPILTDSVISLTNY